MKSVSTMAKVITCVGLVFLCCLAHTGSGVAQTGPTFSDAVFFGGSGDQRGTGIAIAGGKIYLSGVGPGYNLDGIAIQYSLPPATSPDWVAFWPNQAGPPRSGQARSNDDEFWGVTVTDEGVYFAGFGDSFVYDSTYYIEHKSYLVKFPLTGATGGSVGGSTWYASPNFFSYSGYESFRPVEATDEEGSTFIYTAGMAQPHGASNHTVILAKYDVDGNLLWFRLLSDTGAAYKRGSGRALVALNGNIYVAGSLHYPSTDPNAVQAMLWKYGPAGNQIWVRNSPPGTPMAAEAAVALGNYLYLAGWRHNGPNGGSDVQLLKYDEVGTLIWSKEWGGAADDRAYGIAASGNRLYVVGETASFGSGQKDAFLLGVDPTNGAVVSTNYFGGARDDIARDVQVAETDIYVVGESSSFDYAGNAVGQNDLMLLRYATVFPVAVDIKPGSCPNPLSVESRGVLPVAILGTDDFDVAQVDPESVALEGVGPLRSALEDVAAPFEPYVGKEDALDCVVGSPDGFVDLTLKFDSQEVIDAIEAALGREVLDGEVVTLTLVGTLTDEFGGTSIRGEDVVVILKMGKN
jgi:hypothetical protein